MDVLRKDRHLFLGAFRFAMPANDAAASRLLTPTQNRANSADSFRRSMQRVRC